MKVLVTDPIADAGIDRLREAGHDVVTAYDLTGEALRDAVTDADALVVGTDTQVTAELFGAAPDLQIVSRAGTEVDNVDVDAATDHGVIVATALAGSVSAAAEHVIAMAFATARSIPQSHARLRAGEWAKSDYLGTELSGKTLGIVSLDRIGAELTRRTAALGMDVVAFDPDADPATADRFGVDVVDSLDACLDAADFLAVHGEPDVSLGADELAELAGGFVVDTARADVVDEAALADAVRDGVVRGAAVDVDATESVDPDHPLVDVDDVVLSPHVGVSEATADERVALSAADQVIAAFADEPVGNAVNLPSVDESDFQRIRPYLDLARTAGTVAVQLLDAPVTEVEVTYAGDVAEGIVAPVTARALTGVLAPLVDGSVNAVNARNVARDRGVGVTESTAAETGDFQNLVTVSVVGEDRSVEVAGTEFADDDPRIVRIDGYRIDAVPHGDMLVARNADAPGVIGFIGTVLGEAGVNIAGMFNDREDLGGEALTVYNLDDPVPADVIDRIVADERVIEVKQISLNGV